MQKLDWLLPFKIFALMCLIVFFPIPTLAVWLILILVRYAAKEIGKSVSENLKP